MKGHLSGAARAEAHRGRGPLNESGGGDNGSLNSQEQKTANRGRSVHSQYGDSAALFSDVTTKSDGADGEARILAKLLPDVRQFCVENRPTWTKDHEASEKLGKGKGPRRNIQPWWALLMYIY